MPRHDQRLARILAEARAQQVPRLALDRVRERLRVEFRAAVESGALGAAPQGRGSWRGRSALPWLSAAAVICVVMGLVWGLARPLSGSRADVVAPAEVPLASSSGVIAGVVDGASLAPGASLAAAEGPLRVEHGQRASWVISLGSRARLLSSAGGVVRVELERGVLDAVVSPSALPESFVVLASGTEVSVHGTRFQVHLAEGGRVEVSVNEGEVRVRPVGQSAGASLRAGMRAEFVAGLARGARAPGDARQVPSGAPAHDPHPVMSAAGSPAVSSAVRNEPFMVELGSEAGQAGGAGRPEGSLGSEADPSAQGALPEQALERVSEHIQSCFRRHTPARGELRIEASTRLRLLVQPNGLILEVGLNPPLAPQVEQCVASELAQLNLGSSTSGYRVDREISLSR
jgi:ferric-dicitrate binding protein FerR (iron transport regulator)